MTKREKEIKEFSDSVYECLKDRIEFEITPPDLFSSTLYIRDCFQYEKIRDYKFVVYENGYQEMKDMSDKDKFYYHIKNSSPIFCTLNADKKVEKKLNEIINLPLIKSYMREKRLEKIILKNKT